MKITYFATDAQHNAYTYGKKTIKGSPLKRLPGKLTKRKAYAM